MAPTAAAFPFCSRALLLAHQPRVVSMVLYPVLFVAIVLLIAALFALIPGVPRDEDEIDESRGAPISVNVMPPPATATAPKRQPARGACNWRLFIWIANRPWKAILSTLLGTIIFAGIVTSLLFNAMAIEALIYCPTFTPNGTEPLLWVGFFALAIGGALAFDGWVNICLTLIRGSPPPRQPWHYTPGTSVVMIYGLLLAPFFVVFWLVCRRPSWKDVKAAVRSKRDSARNCISRKSETPSTQAPEEMPEISRSRTAA
ncbi:MAG: hypothetical protein M1838_002408 [Thelocarpon superellum]|nr:MAG: hypothetical protein M1838_002408 [Thelocarpon superellum]